MVLERCTKFCKENLQAVSVPWIWLWMAIKDWLGNKNWWQSFGVCVFSSRWLNAKWSRVGNHTAFLVPSKIPPHIPWGNFNSVVMWGSKREDFWLLQTRTFPNYMEERNSRNSFTWNPSSGNKIKEWLKTASYTDWLFCIPMSQAADLSTLPSLFIRKAWS